MADILEIAGILALLAIWLLSVAWAAEGHAQATRERTLRDIQANEWRRFGEGGGRE